MGSIDIILVLDASGSMQPLIKDTVGGVNKFIEDQRKEPGDAYVTLHTFDNRHTERYAAKHLRDVPVLTVDDYYGGHGGSTSLLDAVGFAIKKYEALPIKADKTMFVIDTDGEENASVEWSFETVSKLIEQHQNNGWGFVFLGANNSQWQGYKLGASGVGAYVANSMGVDRKYANLTDNTSMVRSAAGSASATISSQSYDTDDEPA